VHDQVEITAEGGILRARFSGMIGGDLLPLAASTFKDLAVACTAHGCAAILLDTRGVDLEIKRWGIYHAAFALAKAATSRIPVAAVVESSHMPADNIFSKLAGLAGALVAVFVEEARALAWLDRVRRVRTGRT
jgi:hypothetical protein